METKTLYQKAEKAINQAFEVAKKSVKTMSEKAGEAAHVSKLLIEKATLEHRVSKKFAELGSKVFEKALKGNEDVPVSLEDAEISGLIEETKKLDTQLNRVEAELASERKRLTRKSSK